MPLDLTDFPSLPGVYLMKDGKGVVLYVGKAKNLKARIKSYFGSSGDGRAQVPFLLSQMVSIDTIVVTSEKEALLLENTLIKQYQPRYNVLLKDDKGYISLKMTTDNPWPMLQLVRLKGAAPKDGSYFGPFTSAMMARQMFDLIGKCFLLRQCSDEEFARRQRPCILYQIKRCSAPCVGLISNEDYLEHVQEAMKLLKGQNETVIKQLTDEMNRASEALEFEKAGELLERKRFLEKSFEKQSVDATTDRDTDVWALYREGAEVVITKLFWRASKLVGSHHFDFSEAQGSSDEVLESFLLQHYLSETAKAAIPAEILLHQEISNAEALGELISDSCKRKVAIVIPVKGDKKKLCQISYMNAEATFKQRKDAKVLREKALLDMQEQLGLSRYPRMIDCFDNSHFAGTELVSSCVTYVDGEKYKPAWRKYRIRSVDTADDYAMMKEVIERRYTKAKAENNLPDLIIIDGGKGHLKVAAEVLKKLNIISCDLIALAKEGGRHDKGQTRESIFTEKSSKPIGLGSHSAVLFLLQTIRDEAHRFVLAFQSLRRKKASIKSELDAIPGIGPAKKKGLIQAFGSVREIKKRNIEELSKVKGITLRDAEFIFEYFHLKPKIQG